MDKNLNTQWEEILKIAGVNELLMIGGLICVDLNKDQINNIMEKAPDFITLDDSHNYSPTRQQFIDFCNENPQFRLEAYLVSPARPDYRVDLVGAKALSNERNRDILLKWVEDLTDNGNIDIPDENGIYDDEVRVWWD